VKAAGIDTIVDLTPLGLGRDVAALEQAVSGTGLQVIVSTGLYTSRDLPWPFRMTGPGTLFGGPDPLETLFAHDIEEGIAGTTIRAGILKCSTDADGMIPGIERVVRACAKVSVKTGCPIYTHTHPVARGGLEQQQVFREEGVDLGRVIIGHSGDHTDLDYLERLIHAGSLLGMDRFGTDLRPPDTDARADTIAALCARGYADRMVLSHDACCFDDWYPPQFDYWQMPPLDRLLYIKRVVAPALKERGVSSEQIDEMMIHTPRRFFELGR
jgi:phosphotriesterase-related protein